MSKLCDSCGRELPDNAINCTYCGNPIGGYQNNYGFDNLQNKSKKNIKPVLMIGGIVALLAVVAVVLVLLLGGGAESACEDYVDAIFMGNSENFENFAPEDIIKDLEKKYGVDLEDVCDYLEETAEEAKKEMEEEYDSDLSFCVEVLDSGDVYEDTLKEIKKGLKDNYKISKSDITDVKVCCVKSIIESDDCFEVDYTEFCLAEIDGEWYPVEYDGKLPIEDFFEETAASIKSDYYDEYDY